MTEPLLLPEPDDDLLEYALAYILPELEAECDELLAVIELSFKEDEWT